MFFVNTLWGGSTAGMESFPVGVRHSVGGAQVVRLHLCGGGGSLGHLSCQEKASLSRPDSDFIHPFSSDYMRVIQYFGASSMFQK